MYASNIQKHGTFIIRTSMLVYLSYMCFVPSYELKILEFDFLDFNSVIGECTFDIMEDGEPVLPFLLI